MANAVSTTESGMNAARSEFGNKVSEFTAYRQHVNDLMAALHSSWNGTAATAYQQAMTDWQSNFNTVINKLSGLMEKMGANTATYADTESSAVTSVNSFSSALPGV